MTGRPTHKKPAHLDLDPRSENRQVFDQKLGKFRAPTPHFIQTIPVELVAPLYSLPKSAVFAWLACWFLHGCNRGKPFTLNRSTALRFGLNRQNKRRGLRALESAGLIKVQHKPGRLPVISVVE